jgi:hypothetical protein
MAASWDGSTWRVAAQAMPDGVASASLTSVSCADVNWCVAVGQTLGSSSPAPAQAWNPRPRARANDDPGPLRRPVATAWNGTGWVPTGPFPALPDGELQLGDVSCAGNRCLAIATQAVATLNR